MSTRAEKKDMLGQPPVVEKIDQQVGHFHLHGAHLWSPDLKPEEKGDGYLILELTSGGHLLVVADISLGRYDRATLRITEQGQLVNESIMLEELLQLAKSAPSNPADFILYFSQKYYPDYLRDRTGRWGFSVTAALLDPASPDIKVAAMGTNFYGIGRGDNHFSVAQPPDRNFFFAIQK